MPTEETRIEISGPLKTPEDPAKTAPEGTGSAEKPEKKFEKPDKVMLKASQATDKRAEAIKKEHGDDPANPHVVRALLEVQYCDRALEITLDEVLTNTGEVFSVYDGKSYDDLTPEQQTAIIALKLAEHYDDLRSKINKSNTDNNLLDIDIKPQDVEAYGIAVKTLYPEVAGQDNIANIAMRVAVGKAESDAWDRFLEHPDDSDAALAEADLCRRAEDLTGQVIIRNLGKFINKNSDGKSYEEFTPEEQTGLVVAGLTEHLDALSLEFTRIKLSGTEEPERESDSIAVRINLAKEIQTAKKAISILSPDQPS